MELRKAYSNITKMMIYVVFLSTSYAALFSMSFFDDLAIIVIALLELVFLASKHEGLKKEVAIIGSLLLVQLIWLVISMLIGSVSTAVQSFLTYLKILVVFAVPLVEEIDNKDKMLRNLVLLSIPNIMYAMYEFFCTYVRGIYLPGKYDASGYYRLQGLTGHPIFFSLVLVVVLMYWLYFSNSKMRIIFIPVCFLFALLTWSELAQVGAILLLGYKVFEYTKAKNLFIRYASLVSGCLLTGLLFVIFIKMLKETYTIRYVSVIETLKNINFYNLFIGNGFGTFTENGLSESYIFHVFYDSGLLGIVLLGIIIFFLYRFMFSHQSYAGIFVLSLYLVSMFINEGYMVPFIAFIPVVCGIPVTVEKKRKLYIVFE